MLHKITLYNMFNICWYTHHHQVSILGSVDHEFTTALEINKPLFTRLDIKPHTKKCKTSGANIKHLLYSIHYLHYKH